MAERTIVLDGFSQDVRDDRLAARLRDRARRRSSTTYGQLIINTFSAPPTFAQVGAVEALRGPQDDVEAMVAEFRARRDLVVDGLNAIPGIRASARTGAFYVFPEISGDRPDRRELADRLLHEAGVCVLAGTAFGGVGHGPHPDLVRELAREPDRGARRGSGRSSMGRSARRGCGRGRRECAR